MLAHVTWQSRDGGDMQDSPCLLPHRSALCAGCHRPLCITRLDNAASSCINRELSYLNIHHLGPVRVADSPSMSCRYSCFLWG